jgi:hypothetical protein
MTEEQNKQDVKMPDTMVKYSKQLSDKQLDNINKDLEEDINDYDEENI